MMIDICVCTFRRPQIVDTLNAIAQITRESSWGIRVIVADNDRRPNAQSTVEFTCAKNGLNFLYVHAPFQNISIARNACLDHATGDRVAFVDDDEIPTREWLSELMEEMDETGAGMVLGPVKAIYGANAPGWMRKGDFHSIRPTWVNGEIVTGYTSNVLLDLNSPQIKGRRFRVDLGTSGGEDTVFCSEYHRDGGEIAFAENAIVGEIVPEKRATLSWLIDRRLRFGQTHAILLSESGNKSGFMLAMPKAVMCFSAALATIFNRQKSVFWLLRGALHVGVLSKYIGMKTIHPYKKS